MRLHIHTLSVTHIVWRLGRWTDRWHAINIDEDKPSEWMDYSVWTACLWLRLWVNNSLVRLTNLLQH